MQCALHPKRENTGKNMHIIRSMAQTSVVHRNANICSACYGYADAKEKRDFRALEVPRPVDPRSGRPVGSPVD